MWYEVISGTENEVRDKINGAIYVGPISTAGVAVGGLTLEFSDPASTVTFSGSLGDVLTPQQIFAEILAEVTGLEGALRSAATNSSLRSVMLSFWHTDGCTIADSGTANDLLLITDTLVCGGPLQVAGFAPSTYGGAYAAICVRS